MPKVLWILPFLALGNPVFAAEPAASLARKYWDCVHFLSLPVAQQRMITDRAGSSWEAKQSECWRLMRLPPARFNAPSPQDPAPLNCATDSQSHIYCTYGNEAPAPLHCGTAAPSQNNTCYDSAGRPTTVSCYTNLSDYTSCH